MRVALCASLLCCTAAAATAGTRASALSAGACGPARLDLSSNAGTSWSACSTEGARKCFPAAVPGTALSALIQSGAFPGVTDPFVDAQLLDVPDISVTGPGFYTLSWEADVGLAPLRGDSCGPGLEAGPPAVVWADPHVTLTLRQVNYRAALRVNGTVVPPLGAPSGAAGMFRRYIYDIPAALSTTTPSSSSSSPAALSLALLVSPPDHPGNTSSACHACGQGGNHAIAQDVTSQYSAGWDWVGGTPDRNTGPIDAVTLRATGPVMLADAIAVTLSAEQAPGAAPDDAANVSFSVTVAALNLGSAAAAGVLTLSIPSLGPAPAGVVLTVPVTIPAGGGGGGGGVWNDIELPPVSVAGARLWWPHTMGTPFLYDATLSFTVNGDSAPSDVLSWRPGLRIVGAAVDAKLGGQAFSVNHRRLFLQGGNFIAVDQLTRFNADAGRYASEVRMHAEAGLNLIRLWGGSGGHGAGLADAADELGVFLMHEFWMSGDNNGRWAGSYDWPADHSLYLGAAADTVRLLRGHPALLFMCGGNELFPPARNPPPDIAAALPELAAKLDPSRRLFIMSSMSSFENFDPTFALAPQDGPYGMLDERRFFERNPGLLLPNGSRADSFPIAFQPELGSSACPDFESLARFLSPAVREAIPPRNASAGGVDAVWVYHRYLPFQNSEGVDTVYAYGAPANASEYAVRAALAQARQVQGLFEGFADGMWSWYGAVIMWKTQGPWPAFRGALYDPYLALTGSGAGARAATGGRGPGAALHLQLHPGTSTLTVLNRGGVDAPPGLTATVWAYDISTGESLLQPPLVQALPAVPAGSPAVRLPAVVSWPPAARPGAVLLFRLALAGAGGALSTNEYWLSNLSPDAGGAAQDYSALGLLRDAGPYVALAVTATAAVSPSGELLVNATLAAAADAPAVAFAVRLSLRYGPAMSSRVVTSATGFADDRVLPIWPSAALFFLVPGESRSVSVSADGWPGPPGPVAPGAVSLRVEGWNVRTADVPLSGTTS